MSKKWYALLVVSLVLLSLVKVDTVAAAESPPKVYTITNQDGVQTHYAFQWDKDKNKVMVKYSKYGWWDDGDGGNLVPLGDHSDWGDFNDNERQIANKIGSASSEKEMLQSINGEIAKPDNFLTDQFEGTAYNNFAGRTKIQADIDAMSSPAQAPPPPDLGLAVAAISASIGSVGTTTTQISGALGAVTSASYNPGDIITLEDSTGTDYTYTVISSKSEAGAQYVTLRNSNGKVYTDAVVYNLEGKIRLDPHLIGTDAGAKDLTIKSSATAANAPSGPSMPSLSQAALPGASLTLTPRQTYTATGGTSIYIIGPTNSNPNVYKVAINGQEVFGTLNGQVLTVGNQQFVLNPGSAAATTTPTANPANQAGVKYQVWGAVSGGKPTGAGQVAPPQTHLTTVYLRPDGTMSPDPSDNQVATGMIALSDTQLKLLNELKSPSFAFDSSGYLTVESKTTDTNGKITEQSSLIFGPSTTALPGSIAKEVSEFKDGKLQLKKIYSVDPASGDSALQVVQNSKGNSAAFGSEKFSSDDKGNWLYDGREGKSNGQRFDFTDGTYVEKVGDYVVEQTLDGEKKKYTITKKDGKTSFDLGENLYNEKFAAGVAELYLDHVEDFLKITKNNRIKNEGLKVTPGGGLVTADNKVQVTFIKGKTQADDGYTITAGTPPGDHTSVVLKKDPKTGMLSVFSTERSEGKNIVNTEWSATGIKLRTDTSGVTKTYDLELQKGFAGDPNGQAYCDKGSNICVDYKSNYFLEKTLRTYTLVNKKLVPCDSAACKELATKLQKEVENQRVMMGGPTDRERTALGVFGVLESAQSGFGSFTSLFIGDESLNKWKQQVDDFFCSTILLGGTECWTSEICSEYIPRSSKNTLIVQTPSGEFAPVAHVEGDKRSLAYETDDARAEEFLYKISAGIRNPQDSGQEIKYNIYLKGQGTIKLWEEDQVVKEGDETSWGGKNMVLRYDDSDFNVVCLVFINGFPGGAGEICNAIVPVLG